MTPAGGNAIVIMAKAPFPGEAKTRLAADIGNEAALELHRAFLIESIRTALQAGAATVALMCPDARHAAGLWEFIAGSALELVDVWAQDRPGLMAGIVQGFKRAFAEGATRVLVSETDSPTLPLGHYEASFALLGSDGPPALVLGPCADGGYYLAGARDLSEATAQALFEGEPYDGATICDATARRAQSLGLIVALAPPWYDVDTIQDLQRLKSEVDTTPHNHLAFLRAAMRGALALATQHQIPNT